MQTCPKCQYTRKPTETAQEWECPSCGIAYAKFGTVPHGHAHNLEPGTLLVHAEPKASNSIVPNPAELEIHRHYSSRSDSMNLYTAAGFLFGCLMAYTIWNSGDRRLTVFLFPVILAGFPEIIGFMMTRWLNARHRYYDNLSDQNRCAACLRELPDGPILYNRVEVGYFKFRNVRICGNCYKPAKPFKGPSKLEQKIVGKRGMNVVYATGVLIIGTLLLVIYLNIH